MVSLLGCQLSNQSQSTLNEAYRLGFKREILETDPFTLFALTRINSETAPVVIYLEGDGHSMASKYKLSKDPTPHQPLALELALKDPRDNVIYVARPCQYTLQQDSHCHPKYWSSHRFSNEVIQSTHQAIQFIKKSHSINSIHLVGFSGGAGLAALVAAQEPSTLSLITVAGDLNLNLMQSIHNTSTMWGSEDPISVAKTISHIPQHHWSGGKDTTVPWTVAQSFTTEANSPCVKQSIKQNFTHHEGWSHAWPELIRQPMECSKG